MHSSLTLLPKKPYSTPKLVAYGDLTDVTRATGKAGSMDAIKGFKTGA